MKLYFICLFFLCGSISACAGKTKTVQVSQPDTLRRPAGVFIDSGYTHAVLKADGQQNAYTQINGIFGGTAEETPDCSHPSFGHHIREEFNTRLNEYVFAFYIHVHPDNDRCINFDRQRCEIKTYGVVKQVDLAPFKGTWIQAEEEITFGSHGSYQLTLSRVSDGTVLLSYANNDIDMWRSGTTFVRPKWGIYRSLKDSTHLRDEKVLLADFEIEKKIN